MTIKELITEFYEFKFRCIVEQVDNRYFTIDIYPIAPSESHVFPTKGAKFYVEESKIMNRKDYPPTLRNVFYFYEIESIVIYLENKDVDVESYRALH